MTDTTTAPRRLEYMPLTDLVDRLDPDNVKGHDDAGIDESLDRFGYTEPVMLDERTGKLVAGHGRIQRLNAMASDHSTDPERPPEGVLAVDDGTWQVPVVRGWASKDDNEARAYMITANRLTEKGGWTDDLATVLDELAQTPAGLPPGFTTDDVDALLAELGSGELPEQPTGADYADDSERGDPAPPREQQGLHDVALVFQSAAHAEYLRLIGELRQMWGRELPTPMLLIRAMRIAAGHADD